MTNANLPRRPRLDDSLRIAVPTEEKQRLFELAASRRMTVSEFVRSAIARAEGEHRAA